MNLPGTGWRIFNTLITFELWQTVLGAILSTVFYTVMPRIETLMMAVESKGNVTTINLLY